MKVKLSAFILFVFVAVPLLLSGQTDSSTITAKASKMRQGAQKLQPGNTTELGTVVYAQVIDGDTVPLVQLREVNIAESRSFSNPADARKWERLKKKVKKVYPYAQLARIKMEELSRQIDTLDRRKDQKQFIKEAEKAIFSEFEDDIRDMTVSEGIILIKLIDRETGDSSYELVKDLKGGLNAFMWQSVARIFGHNLKSKYDPRGEDRMIEEIVLLIQKGDL